MALESNLAIAILDHPVYDDPEHDRPVQLTSIHTIHFCEKRKFRLRKITKNCGGPEFLLLFLQKSFFTKKNDHSFVAFMRKITKKLLRTTI